MTQPTQLGQLANIVEFLLDYPVEKHKYPDGYPEDLMGDVFPGKDYVIGMCDEAIDSYMDLLISTKDAILRDIARMGIEIFKGVKLDRLKKLSVVPESVYKTDEIQEMMKSLL